MNCCKANLKLFQANPLGGISSEPVKAYSVQYCEKSLFGAVAINAY